MAMQPHREKDEESGYDSPSNKPNKVCERSESISKLKYLDARVILTRSTRGQEIALLTWFLLRGIVRGMGWTGGEKRCRGTSFLAAGIVRAGSLGGGPGLARRCSGGPAAGRGVDCRDPAESEAHPPPSFSTKGLGRTPCATWYGYEYHVRSVHVRQALSPDPHSPHRHYPPRSLRQH